MNQAISWTGNDCIIFLQLFSICLHNIVKNMIFMGGLNYFVSYAWKKLQILKNYAIQNINCISFTFNFKIVYLCWCWVRLW